MWVIILIKLNNLINQNQTTPYNFNVRDIYQLKQQKQMGNDPTKTQCVLPQKGYRVISISRPDISLFLDLLTDYVISPDPKQIDYRRQFIQLQVYSILQEKIRSVKIPVHNRESGFQIKLGVINTAILRITRIFPGSPLQKHNVEPNEFIVGVLEGNFSNIKSFAQLIRNITILAPKTNITHISMGICNQKGKTRMIKIEVAQLKQWQSKGQGLLGCQLAEGWIHKFKQARTSSEQTFEIIQPNELMQSTAASQFSPKIQTKPPNQIELSKLQKQIDEKCNAICSKYSQSGVMERRFRGNYKKEQIVDASIVCKCRPMSLECEKCFIQKEGSFHFFNKKTSRIICMPYNFMMSTEPIK